MEDKKENTSTATAEPQQPVRTGHEVMRDYNRIRYEIFKSEEQKK